uniref:ABC transporter domain-containing protein n=1 Tax=Bionectria ochroleuca TaxID=29856 RepID=A0A8H7NI74_BIOOC
MIAMLERFYDPSTGSISISGDALTNLNPRLYRRIVSLVQQEPTLFQGTIRENIALGIDDPDVATPETSPSSPANGTTVPEADIEAALRAANAWDFVCSLPEGVHTPAGANGTQLSGASASASPSPAPSSATPRSCSSTRRRAPSTRRARSSCRGCWPRRPRRATGSRWPSRTG